MQLTCISVCCSDYFPSSGSSRPIETKLVTHGAPEFVELCWSCQIRELRQPPTVRSWRGSVRINSPLCENVGSHSDRKTTLFSVWKYGFGRGNWPIWEIQKPANECLLEGPLHMVQIKVWSGPSNQDYLQGTNDAFCSCLAVNGWESHGDWLGIVIDEMCSESVTKWSLLLTDFIRNGCRLNFKKSRSIF